MSSVRGTIFAAAFEALGIPDYVFSIPAEEQAAAARTLDRMMRGQGWRDLDYVETDGQPQPDVETGTDPEFDDAIAYNLALRLAPGFGKAVSAFIRGEAKRTYAEVLAVTQPVPAMPASRVQVIGGGDRLRRWAR